jgi:hypothetical protein
MMLPYERPIRGAPRTSRLPRDCRFTLPAPESGAVRHQSKTQIQTLAERYDEQRVSSYTLYCNLPRGHYCELSRQIAVIDRFRLQATAPVDGHGSSDAALSECCATWYTWLLACEAWWTSRCKMLARHYTLHLHMCPIIAQQDTHWPGRRSIDFDSRSGPLFSMFGRSLKNESTFATLTYMTCCYNVCSTKVVRNDVDRVSEEVM